ncbi:MAG TPA: LptF/LptG family permease [Bacteroidia bacterium]|nr:LptF/LptG family permease [Bacteroidia bacterium]MBP7714487.1 LptF/LptG family permease [Bacteroidia bacterium]HOZ82708.1 LptF/LptG family permease [Bacteroidia bacterium]HOZ89964.1 LptF/LptG family permease [Bacteroidia bacterium]HQW18152.1 LptF/LptG family permease [Bacteroidia bacterium]
MKAKILDLYIIKKFLGTFLFAIGLIICIAVVFDISEKVDDFIERHAPLKAIAFDYYLNFIPYFANLFSPLFVFISVIFFTSKMAGQTEIIAILNSGISFNRFLRPYIISATVIAIASFYLNNWVIPHANLVRLQFENIYIKNPYVYRGRNIHRQIKPGEFVYFESYDNKANTGFMFSIEKFEGGKLVTKLMADRITWDSLTQKWSIENYTIRHINGMTEELKKGIRLDTTLSIHPSEFNRRMNFIEAMDFSELNSYIKEEKSRGSEVIPFYEVEKYRRTSYPFATFILTLIGVAISSKKVRGGIGLQLGAGILLSFTYIMFMQVSTTFATNGNLPAVVAVWIPNLVYAFIAIYLLRKAPK